MNKQNSFSNKTIEALKMAIEALESIELLCDDKRWYLIGNARKSCKEALAEAEKQEIGEVEIRQMLKEIEWCHQELEKKEWQSLSDDEMKNLISKSGIPKNYDYEILAFARAIEQALKEKNYA